MQETRSTGTPISALPSAMLKLSASGQFSPAERRSLADSLRYDAHSVALLAYEALNVPIRSSRKSRSPEDFSRLSVCLKQPTPFLLRIKS